MPQLWDGIDWNDPSLYQLMSDELTALNDGPVLPQPPAPVISEPSPDVHAPTLSPHASSPGGGELLSEHLCDANLSTWAAQNATCPVIRCQTPPPRLSDAQKASRKIKQDQRTEIAKRLHDAVAKHLQEQKIAVELLSLTHSVTPQHINDLINNQTKYRTARKIHLTNALIHTKAKEMNSGMSNHVAYSCSHTYILSQQDQPNGSRYTLVKLREMVAEDPQMQNLMRVEKAAYVAALSEHREKRVSSMRANNMAAARDVLVTTERVVKEVYY